MTSKGQKPPMPRILYPPGLPILQKREEILAAIRQHPVVIISGETGSGKTTQIPKICLEAGRGLEGKIGCTQPRRIAAMTVANRIAEELGETLGQSIGYKIRFNDQTRKSTRIKIMTDGILLAETRGDPKLFEYDTLIVDEAHERSLNIDFILGILKTLVFRRKNLKLIITSATIDTEKFSKAFHDAPVIEVSGRMYPVDIHYPGPEKEEENHEAPSHVEQAAEAVDRIIRLYPAGDILVFMPTQQDIVESMEVLRGRKYDDTTIMPLFARLSAKDQMKVFAKTPERKIIVATNIAETSITIPGIKYVVDTGLARIPHYTPRTRTTSLLVSPVSKSSADQRAGRCGRVENGICFRLYSEADYQGRPAYTPPEILRANLAEVILRMIDLRIGDVASFPFIDRPAPKSIADGFDLLEELGAIVFSKPGAGTGEKPGYELTAKGREMARIPLDPRLSGMLLEARNQGCEKEILVIAAALSVMDPRERPLEKTAAADEAHAVFFHPASDFMVLLNIWKACAGGKGSGKALSRRFCKEHFLSFRRMREWVDVYDQLADLLKQTKPPVAKPVQDEGRPKEDLLYGAIHKAILSGFLSNIALNKEKNLYTAARGREVMIFPGSILFNKTKPWIVAAEIVETSRVFARTAAAIDPEWLEPLAGNLCRYTYSNPRWDARRGEVTAREQVSLFGLVIVADRKVSYGRIDPEEAGRIFIQSALVEGAMNAALPFMEHNRKLMDRAADMENRLRRKDVLADDSVIFSFYESKLKGCFSIRTLKKMLKEKQSDDFLRMKPADVFRYLPEEETLNCFPDEIIVGDQKLACVYDFKPGEETDGVTVRIPASLAPSIPQEEMDWIIPGLFREKISALIKGLPKVYRKQLVPIAGAVDAICSEMPREKGSLLNTLGKFIHDRFRVDIPVSAWPEKGIDAYLNLRMSIVDKAGKEIRSSREKSVLREAGQDVRRDLFDPIRKKWERTHITTWDFPDLPESLEYRTPDGKTWRLFPALQAEPGSNPAENPSISLRLFADQEKALAHHQQGLVALYGLDFSKDLKFLKKTLVLPKEFKAAAEYSGGLKTLENQLYHEVMVRSFSANIRTREDFYWHGKNMISSAISRGRELLDNVLPVLRAFNDTRLALERLKSDNRFNRTALDLLDELILAAERLVPPDFIHRRPADRWVHLDRYLKALVIRAKRAILDFEKDRAKTLSVKGWLARLEETMASLTPESSKEKRAATEELFWLLEEYKVSVYAQELKTVVSVSDKVLKAKINALSRMA
jgi:ATP-dependent helicase HrpA